MGCGFKRRDQAKIKKPGAGRCSRALQIQGKKTVGTES